MFDVGVCAGHHSCELFLMMCALRIKGCNWPCPSSTACVCSDNTQDKWDIFLFVCVCARGCVTL